jgi:hypothetical protein
MYNYLLTYRYAEILCDLTVVFLDRYIDTFSRTLDKTCPPSTLPEAMQAGGTSGSIEKT